MTTEGAVARCAAKACTPGKWQVPGWRVCQHQGGGLCFHLTPGSRVARFFEGVLGVAFSSVFFVFFGFLAVNSRAMNLNVPLWWLVVMGLIFFPMLGSLLGRSVQGMFGTLSLVAIPQTVIVRQTLLWWVKERRYSGTTPLHLSHRTVGKTVVTELWIWDERAAPRGRTLLSILPPLSNANASFFTLPVSRRQARPLAEALSQASGRRLKED